MAFLYIFAIIAGGVSAIASGSNASLSKGLEQPITAALIVLVVNAVALVAVAAVRGQGLGAPTAAAVAGVPWWAWIGGVFSAVVIASQLFVAQEVGAGPYIGLTVTASVIVSLALDHYGLVGFKEHPINWPRAIGGALLVGGVVLVAKN